MPDSNKTDHDLLIELRTMMQVLIGRFDGMERSQQEERAARHALENRVNTIETDRAAKIPDYENFRHKTNNELQKHEAKFNRLEGQVDGANKALSFSKWAMGIAVAVAVALGVVQLKPAQPVSHTPAAQAQPR